MTNEQTTEKEDTPDKQKESGAGAGGGDKSEKEDLVTRAIEARKGLEEQNKRMEENIARLEKIKSEEILGGQTEAGHKEEEPKDLTPSEYVKKVMKGETPEQEKV